jgi:hypothetical protein
MEVSNKLYGPASFRSEIISGTHWVEGWDDSWFCLQSSEEEKTPLPCQNSNPGPSCAQPNLYTDYAILSHDEIKMDVNESGREDAERIYVLRDGDRWRTFLHTVIKQRVPQNAANF